MEITSKIKNKSIRAYLSLVCCILFSLNHCFAQVNQQGADTGKKDSLSSELPTILDLMKKSPPHYLTLEKNGAVKRIRFYVGNKIEFTLKDDVNRYHPRIGGIGDSSVMIYDTPIPLSRFESVYIRPERPFIRILSGFLIGAGIGYLALDAVNNSFSPNRETIIVSTSFVVPGALLMFLIKKRRIKLNENRYLKTIRVF
jgi:hypothetical protein